MAKADQINYLRQFPGIENDLEWKKKMDEAGITTEDLYPELKETPEPSTGSDLVTGAMATGAGLVKGATKDWYDEAYGIGKAGLKKAASAITGDQVDFSKEMEAGAQEARQAVEGAIEKAPLVGGTAEVVGDIATDVMAGGRLLKGAKALSPAIAGLFEPAKSLTGALAKGVAAGAVPGAISGAVKGAGEGVGLEGKASGAVSSAMLSGALGGVGGAIGKGVTYGRDVVAKRVATPTMIQRVKTAAPEEMARIVNANVPEAITETAEKALPVAESKLAGATTKLAQQQKSISEAAGEVGKQVNVGKAAMASEIVSAEDNIIRELEQELPDLSGKAKRSVSKFIKTFKKEVVDPVTGETVEQLKDVPVPVANEALKTLRTQLKKADPSTANKLSDAIFNTQQKLKQFLPAETAELIERTKPVLQSPIMKAIKKGTPAEFSAIMKNKANAQQVQRGLDALGKEIGTTLPSAKNITRTAEFVNAVPNDPTKMENFLVKMLADAQAVESGAAQRVLKTQAARDVASVLNKSIPDLNQALTDLRVSLAMNPKLAKEFYQRKVAQGLSELAQGSPGNFLSNILQSVSGYAGSVALKTMAKPAAPKGIVGKAARAVIEKLPPSQMSSQLLRSVSNVLNAPKE